ncbi:ribonuclease H-like domain-containing protein, partial [Tanacetum coccineum]
GYPTGNGAGTDVDIINGCGYGYTKTRPESDPLPSLTKHIEIDIHFVRDLVSTGHIRVLHVPSRYQYADIFTKGLPTALFDEFRDSLSVRSSPTETAGGC